MADLAVRIRDALSGDPDISEVRMMGGTCFMLRGNMLVCTMKDDGLLVRVGEAGRAAALRQPGTSPMAFSGREMKAYVLVEPAAVVGPALNGWIATARSFVRTMPPKSGKAASAKRTRAR